MELMHPLYTVNTVMNFVATSDAADQGTVTPDDNLEVPASLVAEPTMESAGSLPVDSVEVYPPLTIPVCSGIAGSTLRSSDVETRSMAEELFDEIFGNDGFSHGEIVDDPNFAYFDDAPTSPSPPDLISQIFENDVLPGWLSDQLEASEMLVADRALPISEVTTPTRLFGEFQDRVIISTAFLQALIMAFHGDESPSLPPVLEAEPRPFLAVRPSTFDLTHQ